MIFLTKFPCYSPVYNDFSLQTMYLSHGRKKAPKQNPDEPCFFCSPDVWVLSCLILYFLECSYHFYFYKVWHYTTHRRWPQCLYLSMMPRFSVLPWRKPGRKSSNPGTVCRTAWPFGAFPKRFGALPLFSQYWKFLPYLQNTGYLCGWLYFPGSPWQDWLYIPGTFKTSPTLWWKSLVCSGGHRFCTGR